MQSLFLIRRKGRVSSIDVSWETFQMVEDDAAW